MTLFKIIGFRRFSLTAIFIMIFSIIDAIGVYAILPLIEKKSQGLELITKNLEYFLPTENIMIYIAAIITISSGLARIYLNYLVVHESEDMRRIIATNCLKNLSKEELYEFKNNSKDDLSKIIITDIDNVMNYRLRPQLTIFAFGSSLALIVILLLLADWFLTIITITLLFITYLLIYLISKNKFRTLGERQSILNAKRYQLIDIFHDKFEKMKSSRRISKLCNDYDMAGSKLVNVNTINNMLSISPRYIIEMLALLSVIIMLTRNGNNYLDYNIEILSIFVLGFLKTLPLIQGIYHSRVNMKFGLASLENLKKLTTSSKNTYPKISNLDLSKNILVRAKSSEILNFQLLKEFELCLKQGQCYIINGISGAGKTTLLNVLSMLEKKFDCSYSDEQENFITPSIIYQSNKCRLLPTTLLKNIEWYSNSAIKKIDLSKELLLLGFNKKMASLILEMENVSQNLSSGQMQRLELLQSIKCDANIYLLDEPFSNLDYANANVALQYVINRCKETRSIALITSHSEFDYEIKKQTEEIKIQDKNVIQTTC